MNEKDILRISMIVCAIGIVGILFAQATMDVKLKDVGAITKSDMDNYVRINGVISNFFSSEKVISFNLEDRTGSVMVVLFNNKEKINKEIKKAEVIGKVSFYNGKLEIIADSITAVY